MTSRTLLGGKGNFTDRSARSDARRAWPGVTSLSFLCDRNGAAMGGEDDNMMNDEGERAVAEG